MKAKLTKFALVVIITASTVMAACSPDKIVTGSSKAEQAVQTYIQETCRQDANGNCKTMGQP